MKTLPLALVAFLCSVVLLAGHPSAAMAASGVISGQVANGTDGGATTEGLTVTLYTLQNDNVISQQYAVTGSAGDFRFQGLDTDASLTYVVATTYAEVRYRSDTVQFASGEAQRTANVVVYETTDQPASIQVDSYTVVVEQGQPGALSVFEDQVVHNTGDRTFIGVPSFRQGESRRETLYFNLPRAASDVRLLSGVSDSSSWVDFRGLVSTEPLPPGRREVTYHYVLPVVAPEVGFAIQSKYPILAANLLLGDGLVAASPWLTTENDITAQGKQFRRYSAYAITPDGMVAAQLGAIRIDYFQRNLKWGLLAGSVALLLAALGLGVWWAQRHVSSTDITEERIREERAWLVEEAARLDLRHEAGELGEDEYARLRGEAKSRLVELTRQLLGRGTP